MTPITGWTGETEVRESRDRQVKMTDDTGVERRAGEGSTGRYWGTGQRDRGTVESCQESPESHSQNSGFTF